jgi:hypothetical protein
MKAIERRNGVPCGIFLIGGSGSLVNTDAAASLVVIAYIFKSFVELSIYAMIFVVGNIDLRSDVFAEASMVTSAADL